MIIWLPCSAGYVSEPQTIHQQCEDGATLIPYPYECQLYYNCSREGYYDIRRNMPGNMQECSYPQLFNTKTLHCDDFETVECGARNETKDGCKNKTSLCRRGLYRNNLEKVLSGIYM